MYYTPPMTRGVCRNFYNRMEFPEKFEDTLKGFSSIIKTIK